MLKRLKKLKEKHKNRRHVIRNTPSAFDKAILSWVAPETIQHERGTIWKVFMGIIVIGIVVWGLLNNAWTMSLAVAAVAIVHYLAHLEHPKDVEVVISKIGIKVGARKYPYSRIRAFWLIYEAPYTKTLNIRVEGDFLGDITIQLGNQSPSPVREVLMEYIPELEGQTEKLSDIFLRLFKI